MIRTFSLMMCLVLTFASPAMAADNINTSAEATFVTILIGAGLFVLVVLANLKNAKRDHRD